MSIDFSKTFINQPTINIGMIGSVSNGKSSITEKVTGVKTQKYQKEQERNITIKLGYANAKIYKCPNCPNPQSYQPHSSSINSAKCKYCNINMDLVKHISFCDSPGHVSLMATMLNGVSIMDTTILVESAANQTIAQQTKEHLLAIGLSGLTNSIVCMNKLDLVKKEVAYVKMDELKKSLQETNAKDSPIVPIAANYGINIDVLCEYICKYIPEPKRNIDSALKMIIIRSFNINKQETSYMTLQGGVIGGSIINGVVHIGDKIIIYPGIVTKKNEGWEYKPLIATVESINSETTNLEYAIPGGLIGMKLDIDPGLTINDGLVGNIVTNADNTEEYVVYDVVNIKIEILDRNENNSLNKKEIIVINSNACNEKAEIKHVNENKIQIKLLEKPLCSKNGEYVTISKFINGNILVIGRGKVIGGIQTVKS